MLMSHAGRSGSAITASAAAQRHRVDPATDQHGQRSATSRGRAASAGAARRASTARGRCRPARASQPDRWSDGPLEVPRGAPGARHSRRPGRGRRTPTWPRSRTYGCGRSVRRKLLCSSVSPMCRIGQGGHSRVVASAQSALTLVSGSGQPQAPCGEHHSLSRVRSGAGPGVTQRITSCAVLDLINLASREALIQNRPCIVWARIGPARSSNERNHRPCDERPEDDHADAHHNPSPLVPSIMCPPHHRCHRPLRVEGI